MFCKVSRIWVGKKLVPAIKYLFHCELKHQKTPENTIVKTPEATTQKCSFKVFFSKVGKSLKRTCEGVYFLVKFQVESQKLY